MTIRLTVRTAVWRSQIAQLAASVDGLVPVVKGNGYGFGRDVIAGIAAEFADTIAVGTVHELAGLPATVTPLVLTPTLAPPEPVHDAPSPILTVGHQAHVEALGDWGGRVIVKRSSAMQRYGTTDRSVLDAATAAGLDVAGIAIHLPLAGTDVDRDAAIRVALDDIDPALPVWLSHLAPDTYGVLPSTHRYRLRVGTSLWHGDKSALELHAQVLDVRSVSAGDTAGYRLGDVAGSGHLVMIGAGTANGVGALPGGLSPFHFGRSRMALHEPPHMHTSMAFVAAGDPLPNVGDWADLQRPLHMTTVDEFRWL